jgi:RNA polymerase sigma factor (sigma-70 family)
VRHATIRSARKETELNEQNESSRLYADCAAEGSVAQSDAFQVLSTYLYRIAYAMLWGRTEGEALAQDCVQKALIKIHANLAHCQSPAAFREWSAQILRRVVLDELRRPEYRRLVPLPEEEEHAPWLASSEMLVGSPDLHTLLMRVIADGPLSERSRRVVIGRYLEEQPDETLAQRESSLTGQAVLPSHIQVTRAKNLSALRRDTALLEHLRTRLGA